MTAPINAKTKTQIRRLLSDNFPLRDDVWSILIREGKVSLHGPAGGVYVSIPRLQFDAIVRWYLHDQNSQSKGNE